MMRQNGRLWMTLVIVFCFALMLAGCKNGGLDLLDLPTSDSIYDTVRTTPYEPKEPYAVHRASHGYTLKQEQGYNHWFYMADEGSEMVEMTHQNKQWAHKGARIRGPLMSPASGTSAIRMFVSPYAGMVTISGTVRMSYAGHADVEVRVLVNDVQVYPTTGGQRIAYHDTTGFYHETQVELVIGDTVRFMVDGLQDSGQVIYWNPIVDFTNRADTYIHFGTSDFLGDVHPYFYDDRLYMFYLARDGSFSSTLAISDDMINFEQQPLTVSRLNAPGSFYYVLGVIKEGNYFRSFYGEGRNVGSSRSLDLIHWESGIVWDEDTYARQYSPASNYPAGTRDPYAFYDPDINRYHIIATGYRANQNYAWSNTTGYDAYLVLFTSTEPSLSDWEKNPVTGNPGFHRPLLHFGDWYATNSGDPECPQMFKIGNRWYILASMAGRGGDHWVGRPSYWIGDENTKILDMDWQANIENEHFLDGEDLCAAQVVQIGDKFYLFGWITQSHLPGGWGGTLNIIREVFQRPDGTLGTRLDSQLMAYLNAGKVFSIESDQVVMNSGAFNLSEEGAYKSSGISHHEYDDYAEMSAVGTFGRSIVTLEVDIDVNTTAFGIVVTSGAQAIEIGLRKQHNQWQIFLKNRGVNGKVSAVFDIDIDPGPVRIVIILEHNIAEIFVNDNDAMVARASANLDHDVDIAYFQAGAPAMLKIFEIAKLVSASDFGN